jgi:ethanolamine ammonia-lyase small subunit
MAHGQARDAVHAGFEVGALPSPALRVASAAADRRAYLMRPDLGRRLDEASAGMLEEHRGDYDLAIVLADGLSPGAVGAHGAGLLGALLPGLEAWAVAPLVVAEHARVALGDKVAVALGARAVLVLIGERPGLSTPESLGAYLTWAPGESTTDADRNCVSNIHPAGLGYGAAARTLLFLLGEMRAMQGSGVQLKDLSATDRIAAPS